MAEPPSTDDANVDLLGFTAVRADRDTKASGKSKGGGLIMYVNNRWCNPGHISVKTVSCCRDLELLAVSLRPYYLPREFSHVITVCVYIPPRADARSHCLGDFFYNSELCHIQKYADDTAIVGCIREDREEEYRRLVGDFAAWCHTNHLQAHHL
ncbi:hypothetical protein L3Q82_017888 [Scortum barcoo]|uniref:Uncharacterized protein n=1 Tax=Scortum barcoo TaxID=214431 RepID=A0ACB8VI44_9TELE|nr:hypothetical protein L3Q82_017888 [Scortum barcoo]